MLKVCGSRMIYSAHLLPYRVMTSAWATPWIDQFTIVSHCKQPTLVNPLADTAVSTSHLIDDLWGRRPKEVSDEFQLVHHIPPWKQRFAQKNLGKDAPNAPDVDCRRVLCEERPAQLWGAVPSCGNVVCPEDGGRHIIE